jgi:hypothetical protein
MLNLNPSIVFQIIEKAKEYQAKEGSVTPDASPYPSDDLNEQVLTDNKEDLGYREISGVIHELEPDQRAELIALMRLGRGDFQKVEWSENVKNIAENMPSNVTRYLFSKPLVAEYLAEGLNLFNYSYEDEEDR